ncbi:MAG: hypothetical protein N2055_08210, partial [Tepidimonas taiwanensis]|nr:hypothetical protein [Tepidimonas taiwanensis]
MWASEALLSAFDVDGIEPEAMLWQTGYLTIREHIITPRGPMYTLALPNHEVRTALNEALTIAWLPQSVGHQVQGASMRLYQALAQGDT